MRKLFTGHTRIQRKITNEHTIGQIIIADTMFCINTYLELLHDTLNKHIFPQSKRQIDRVANELYHNI